MSQERSVRKNEVVRSGVTTRLVVAVTICLALMCFCTTARALELGMAGAPADDGAGGASPENTAIGPNANASSYYSGSGLYVTAVGAHSTASSYESTAMGAVSTASGAHSTASGYLSTASDWGSTATGDGGGRSSETKLSFITP